MLRILEELKGAGKIAISGHVRPDGDCIGSCIGLYLYLKKAMPEADGRYLEQPAEIFFLHRRDRRSENGPAVRMFVTTYSSRWIRPAIGWAQRREVF